MVNRMVGFTRGGGEIWDLQMARHLRELGVDVTMVYAAPGRGDPPDPVEDLPAETVRTPHLQERALAAPRGIGGALADIDARLFVDRVADYLADREFDVVHVNSRPEFARHRDRFDQPVVLKMNGPPHSLWYDRLHPWRSSYDFMEVFDTVVTTGVTTDVVESNTQTVPIVPINPGVDTDHFTPLSDESAASGLFQLLFVGRFVPAKHLTLLVDAVATLCGRHDIELVLVGNGPLRDDIKARVADHGLGDAVTFAGYVDNQKLPAYYRRADSFVLSSRTENCPITVLEAMSCGTPAVVPRLGWLPNLVTDGEDGLLYKTGSEAALIDALETLVDADKRRHELGASARETAVDRFEWGQRADRLRLLYDDLLADRLGQR